MKIKKSKNPKELYSYPEFKHMYFPYLRFDSVEYQLSKDSLLDELINVNNSEKRDDQNHPMSSEKKE